MKIFGKPLNAQMTKQQRAMTHRATQAGPREHSAALASLVLRLYVSRTPSLTLLRPDWIRRKVVYSLQAVEVSVTCCL